MLNSSCNIQDYKANYLSKNILDYSNNLNKKRNNSISKENQSILQNIFFKEISENILIDNRINLNTFENYSNNININYNAVEDSSIKFSFSNKNEISDKGKSNIYANRLEIEKNKDINIKIQKNNNSFYNLLIDKDRDKQIENSINSCNYTYNNKSNNYKEENNFDSNLKSENEINNNINNILDGRTKTSKSNDTTNNKYTDVYQNIIKYDSNNVNYNQFFKGAAYEKENSFENQIPLKQNNYTTISSVLLNQEKSNRNLNAKNDLNKNIINNANNSRNYNNTNVTFNYANTDVGNVNNDKYDNFEKNINNNYNTKSNRDRTIERIKTSYKLIESNKFNNKEKSREKNIFKKYSKNKDKNIFINTFSNHNYNSYKEPTYYKKSKSKENFFKKNSLRTNLLNSNNNKDNLNNIDIFDLNIKNGEFVLPKADDTLNTNNNNRIHNDISSVIQNKVKVFYDNENGNKCDYLFEPESINNSAFGLQVQKLSPINSPKNEFKFTNRNKKSEDFNNISRPNSETIFEDQNMLLNNMKLNNENIDENYNNTDRYNYLLYFFSNEY